MEKYYTIDITFITPVLGGQPSETITTDYVVGKSGLEVPDDELETIPDTLDKRTTGFHRDDNDNVLLYNYVLKGFMKAAAFALNGRDGMPKAFRSKIGKYVFVYPRVSAFTHPGTKGVWNLIDIHERPVRTQTPYGEKVALARSEMLPESTGIRFSVCVVADGVSEDQLRAIFDYGFHHGIGPRRGDGFGSFRYELKAE